MAKTNQRYQMQPYIKETVEYSPEEIEAKHVARFKDLELDQEVFPDIGAPGHERRHFHVISENGHLGPAGITTRHNFHVSYLDVPPGSSAGLHAHDAIEVFIPISGQFAILYGDEGQHRLDLAPLDAISVPVGLLRTFKNVGKVNGLLMVIYDEPGEVLGKIYVNEKMAEEAAKAKAALADAAEETVDTGGES